MVLPGEIIIPPAPACLVHAGCWLLSRQAKIADRDDVLCSRTGAIAIGKSVELFDITERQLCLPFDPGTQSRLQRTMGEFERPGGQSVPIANRQNTRLA